MCESDESRAYWADIERGIRLRKKARLDAIYQGEVPKSFTLQKGPIQWTYTNASGEEFVVIKRSAIREDLEITYAEQIEIENMLGVKKGYAWVFGTT